MKTKAIFNRLFFRRTQLGSMQIFAYSVLILLLSISAHMVQAADPPQAVLDKACTDDQVSRQIKEKWNTIDEPTRNGITRYWNDRTTLDREEAERAQRDIDYTRQWTRDKRLLKNNLTKVMLKGGIGGVARASRELLKHLPTADPISSKLKDKLEDVLKEIEKQGTTSDEDTRILGNNVKHIKDSLDKMTQNRIEWENFKRLKIIIKEFDEVISKAVPKPLTLDLEPNVLRGNANAPIPVTVRVSGGCPPSSITRSTPDSSLFVPITITRTRDT